MQTTKQVLIIKTYSALLYYHPVSIHWQCSASSSLFLTKKKKSQSFRYLKTTTALIRPDFCCPSGLLIEERQYNKSKPPWYIGTLVRKMFYCNTAALNKKIFSYVMNIIPGKLSNSQGSPLQGALTAFLFLSIVLKQYCVKFLT